MIAAIYARKSTDQSGVADEARSVARQVDGARSFIAARGWTLDDAHVHTDDGVSGALFANRAEFQRLMRGAAAGAFNAVVFYDLDRFGRDARRTMDSLYTLADLGVEVWDYSTAQRVDLDSFEGETITFLKARFAQQYREQVRKHTADAMRRKFMAGYVTGGLVFGYDNVRVAKGQTERRINEAEAAVVREIYERYAAGQGPRSIAKALNLANVPSPRAQSGRPSGWSMSTIKAVLARPLYRGEVVYGRSAKAYGRELGKRAGREKGQIKTTEDRWLKREAPELRIVDVDLASRVDARYQDLHRRYIRSVARGGRVPERAHGKYLLSGGLLVCPQCGAHFEARKYKFRGSPGDSYICSSRRRKPGTCTNKLALSIAATDDAVLSVVEDDVLGARLINDLLRLVSDGGDESERWRTDRDRLRAEVERLVGSIAAGVPAESVAPAIKDRETEIARLEVKLRAPRPAAVDKEKLRTALEQRTADWRAQLRAEPQVARVLLRRLVGPLTLWIDEGVPDFIRWEAPAKGTAVLEGLVQHMASPAGVEPASPP